MVTEGPCPDTCEGLQLGIYSTKSIHYLRRGEVKLYTEIQNDYLLILILMTEGGYSATGDWRVSNKGGCIQDFFRCVNTAARLDMRGEEVKQCCRARWDIQQGLSCASLELLSGLMTV